MTLTELRTDVREMLTEQLEYRELLNQMTMRDLRRANRSSGPLTAAIALLLSMGNLFYRAEFQFAENI